MDDFLQQNFELPNHEPGISMAQMIKEIEAGRFFGMVECNIIVPEDANYEYKDIDNRTVYTNTKLRDYFADLPPIYKNADIHRSHIGEFMGNFAAEFNIMEKPRRSLISSMFADNMLFPTPILKWYLQHGLEITYIFNAWEFKPRVCFKAFVDEVCDLRRAADKDPEKFGILSELAKLKGLLCLLKFELCAVSF
jgi:hypothetical protein